MAHTFKVIVSTCDPRGCLFDRVSEDTFPIDKGEEAARHAMSKVGKGYSVLLRPDFNEGSFYREWLSQNGRKFHERRFDHGLMCPGNPLSADCVTKVLPIEPKP